VVITPSEVCRTWIAGVVRFERVAEPRPPLPFEVEQRY
jgi:hypothetical protein